MNSLAKQNSQISVDDFSDSENSLNQNEYFIPQEQNLFNKITLTQTGQVKKEDKKINQNLTQNQTSSKMNQGQNLTKDFLMDFISRNKSSKENLQINSTKTHTNSKKNSQIKYSEEKKIQRITKINKNTKPKILKNLFKNQKSYEKARLQELFEQRIKKDNPRNSSTLLKNKFKEKRVQESTQKNTGKIMIQQIIYNKHNNEKDIFEQCKKIYNNNQISAEDIIDAQIYNIFKLQNAEQEQVILALKYFINNMCFIDDKVDYYYIARIQIFNRLLKLLEGDSYGYHHHRNQNLLVRFYQMQILNIQDVKALVLYLFYCSTRYLTELDYSKAEFFLDLTDMFYNSFYEQLNYCRQFSCDLFSNDAQFDLIDMYLQNCNNIQFFQQQGSVFMKNFDELSKDKQFNIPVFIVKVLKIYVQQIKQQNRVPKILSTIETLIRVMKNH